MSRSLSVNNNDHNSLLLYDTGYRSAECCRPCALQCVGGKRGRKDRRFKNMALMLMWKQLDCVAPPIAWIASISCGHVWGQRLYCNGCSCMCMIWLRKSNRLWGTWGKSLDFTSKQHDAIVMTFLFKKVPVQISWKSTSMCSEYFSLTLKRAPWTTKRQFGLRLFCWWSQLFHALHLLPSISLSLQIS